MYRAEVGLALTDEVFDAYSAAQAAQASGPGSVSSPWRALQLKFQQAEAALLDTIAFVPAEYDNYVFLSNLYNVAGQMIDPLVLREGRRPSPTRASRSSRSDPRFACSVPERSLALGRTDEALKDARVRREDGPELRRRPRCCSRRSYDSARPHRRGAQGAARRSTTWSAGQAGIAEEIASTRGERLADPDRQRRRRRTDATSRQLRTAPDAGHPGDRDARAGSGRADVAAARPRRSDLVPHVARRPRARAAARRGRSRAASSSAGSSRAISAPTSPQEIEIRTWTQRVAANPNDPKAHLGLGYAYQSDGRYDKALEQYDDRPEVRPQRHGRALQPGHDLLQARRRTIVPRSRCGTSSSIDPTHELAAKALGEYYARQGAVQVAHRGRQARGRGAPRAGGPAVPARHGVREARRYRGRGARTTGAP